MNSHESSIAMTHQSSAARKSAEKLVLYVLYGDVDLEVPTKNKRRLEGTRHRKKHAERGLSRGV